MSWWRVCIMVVAGATCVSLIIYGVYMLAQAHPSVKKPHIIFILADDLGWADVSFHGSSQIPTPNIDALAADGVVLNNYYAHPVCTASRAALMTGLYATRLGLQHIPIQPGQPFGLGLNYTLLPQYLKSLGYETHLIGKWHLGCYRDEYTPTQRGFDNFFGLYYGHGDYYTHMLNSLEGADISGLDFWNDMEPAWEAKGQYSTDLFADKAVQLIANLDKSKPQFIFLSHQAVHSGNDDNRLQAPAKNVEKFPYIGENNRTIYAGGSVHELGNIDGHDMWESLTEDVPSPRSELVYNIDPLWSYAAIRKDNFKIVVGSLPRGSSEQRLAIPGGERPQQDLDELVEQSEAAEALKTFYGLRKLEFTPDWRLNATLTCPEESLCDDEWFHSPDNVYLFDLEEDPCECNNLASTHKELLESLNGTLEFYRAQTVAPLNPAVDPDSYPDLHNGTWAPSLE